MPFLYLPATYYVAITDVMDSEHERLRVILSSEEELLFQLASGDANANANATIEIDWDISSKSIFKEVQTATVRAIADPVAFFLAGTHGRSRGQAPQIGRALRLLVGEAESSSFEEYEFPGRSIAFIGSTTRS